MKFLRTILQLIRPHQWVKNGLVFAPLFFGGELFAEHRLLTGAWTFLIFCLAASGLYSLNDVLDRNIDKQHPTKQTRPVASGAVSSRVAAAVGGTLLVLSLALAYWYIPQALTMVILYLSLGFLYSLWLKHFVFFDVLTIAVLYVLRILAGSAATAIPATQWLLSCAFFVALFLILGKRKAEQRHPQWRKVLRTYSESLIDQMLLVAVSLSVMSYSLYTILGIDSPHAFYSIPLVLLGLFRYLQLVQTVVEAESPEVLIFKDRMILGTVVAWIFFMYFVVY